MNGYYQINKIVYLAESNTSGTTVLGAILDGPRGGKLALDAFNLRRLINSALRHDLNMKIDDYLTEYISKTNKGMLVISKEPLDKALMSVANQFNIPSYRVIIGLKHRRLFYMVGEKFILA